MKLDNGQCVYPPTCGHGTILKDGVCVLEPATEVCLSIPGNVDLTDLSTNSNAITVLQSLLQLATANAGTHVTSTNVIQNVTQIHQQTSAPANNQQQQSGSATQPASSGSNGQTATPATQSTAQTGSLTTGGGFSAQGSAIQSHSQLDEESDSKDSDFDWLGNIWGAAKKLGSGNASNDSL